MSYVQGFLVAVPKAKKQAYIQSAQAAAPIFQEYGALRVVETWSETITDGKVTDFKMAVKATPDEAVVFSWIVYQSREHRDEVNAKVMADPRLAAMMDPENSPFDCKRMAYGGFRALVHA